MRGVLRWISLSRSVPPVQRNQDKCRWSRFGLTMCSSSSNGRRKASQCTLALTSLAYVRLPLLPSPIPLSAGAPAFASPACVPIKGVLHDDHTQLSSCVLIDLSRPLPPMKSQNAHRWSRRNTFQHESYIAHLAHFKLNFIAEFHLAR